MIFSHSKTTVFDTIIYPYWDDNNEDIYSFYPDKLSQKLKKDRQLLKTKHAHKRYFLDNKDITVINTGSITGVNYETFRQYSSTALSILKKELMVDRADLVLFDERTGLSPEKLCESCFTGILLTDYSFTGFKTNKSNQIEVERINLVINHAVDDFETILGKSRIISDAVNFTRDLVNGPANVVTIGYMTQTARKLVRKNKKLKLRVFNAGELKSRGFNLMLAVGGGGPEEPTFLEITYNNNKKFPSICLAGKGIIFDTGGLDLKPPGSMDDMKTDMAGAGAVLGIIKAACELNLDVNITGLIPLAENSVDKNSYRPGDIIKAFNRKTVEIKNTDAEGRLVLADALSYSDTKKFDMVMDFATLTGAAIIALGNNITACFFAAKHLREKILSSSENTGEPVWELPLFEDYTDMLKSDVADVANIGDARRVAGTIIGALFLKEFIRNENWIHFDIAGPSYLDKEFYYNPKGATGVMIRTIIDFLQNYPAV